VTNDPATDTDMAWSPDGTQIAFKTNRDGNNEVYVMAADGSGLTNLTRSPADDGQPDWQRLAPPASQPEQPQQPQQPQPQPRPNGCTVVGTPGDDVLVGTAGRDVMCGLGGDDVLRGLAGRDVLRGGGGDDLLVGGAGRDVLRGGAGSDELLARGGGRDRLFGGAGLDAAAFDRLDRLYGVEQL
jgi:Ca2+-binding RTX toxin-like protein